MGVRNNVAQNMNSIAIGNPGRSYSALYGDRLQAASDRTQIKTGLSSRAAYAEVTRCISQGSPEKQNQEDEWEKRFITRNLLMCLWRLTSLKIYS